ncbi:MAG: hypothetical protein HY231_22200 [Acidobacteria bacterium]|nr:hypothetical protein [Acidobacteriota bacterium]
MMVLDEQLQGLGLEEEISRWYRGAVFLIQELRPYTVIKDEAIPALLRKAKKPTFITINHSDFWRKCPAHQAYCIVCLKLSAEDYEGIPLLLRHLFQLPEFRTKKSRMGKVALVSRRLIQFYDFRKNVFHILNLSKTP